MAEVATFLVGLLLIAAGAWMIYRPAGLVAAGVMLALLAVFYERGAR